MCDNAEVVKEDLLSETDYGFVVTKIFLCKIFCTGNDMLGLALDICRFASSDKECVYDRHKEIIKKLKFITLIEQGERINVNTISTAPNNFFSSIYRSIFKESRQKTFQFLNETIDRSFELIFLYKESRKVSDRISCHQIV